MSSKFDKKSLALHKKKNGKIGTLIKVPLKNRNDLSVAYTPGVAAVSSFVAEDARRAYTHTMKGTTVAVVSDGTAVLGLGNIGPYGALPVMEGKCALLAAFTGINAIPLCIDVHTPDAIVDFVTAVAPTFGAIILEDIAAPQCFEIEERLQSLSIPVIHDDQHAIAIAILAGLINALKLVKKHHASSRVVIIGAGASGIATTRLLLAYGFSDIVLLDSRGIVHTKRIDLNPIKKDIAKKTNPRNIQGELADAIINADIVIGLSMPDIISMDMVRSMAEKSIVFALANPNPEIDPVLAKKSGAYIVATGRSDYANQINNAIVFPGLIKSALDQRFSTFTQKHFIAAAQAIAKTVKKPNPEMIIPSLFDKTLITNIIRAVRKAS
jgi:malate dehydrogenase (oxaloacetate-decarboxylating)